MQLRLLLLLNAALISGSAVAASFGVSFNVTAPTPIMIGQTGILTNGDSGNGNLVVAQQVTLGQAATIQSLSFYVGAASGNLVLGIYDASGPSGIPGNLKASTAAFTPSAGWNTANVMSPVMLQPADYWLVYAPSSSNLTFRVQNSGSCRYYTRTYNGTLPATYSTAPLNCSPGGWSFYATLIPGPPPPPMLSLRVSPSSPSIIYTTPLGKTVAILTATWSDGSPFTGTYGFAAPFNDDGGTFALSGANLIINPSGPGVANDVNTIQHVTVQATQ